MVFRIIGIVVGALLALWGLLPLFSGVFNVGVVTLMMVGAAVLYVSTSFATVSGWMCHLWQSAWGKGAIVAAAVLILSVVTVFVAVSAKMIAANYNKPAETATVVVLGASVRDDRPSHSLQVRLDAAAEYLKAHPDAACIVSGGRGDDENYTEAEVMRNYLIEVGVDPQRIYSEDRATSTYENIVFSKEIIEKNDLDPRMAIATQEFHQYRAQVLAKQAGVTDVGAITAHSRPDLLGCYWIRDFFGICHMAVFGE